MDGRWREHLDGGRLLVAGFGMSGGGLYDLTDGSVDVIDDLSTAGVAVGAGRLWRLLRAPGEHTGTCEILSYDPSGVASYLRVDAVRDPHDICIHDGAVHVTSSWDNAVWRVDADGTARMIWQGSTVPDSWHPNSLIEHEGSLYVCAFGRFDRHKDWRGDRHRGSGFVVDLATGHDALAGLDAPHDPRPVDGRWYVCESSVGTLSELDAGGTRVRRIRVGHYARGLAVRDGFAFVGVSAHRDTDDRRAEVVVVDLDAGVEVARISLPCLEIYEILVAPPELVGGVRRGFATNASRVAEQVQRAVRPPERRPAPEGRWVSLATPDQARGLVAAGVAQPLDALRGAVEATVPVSYVAGAMHVVSARVTNRSELGLVTVPPHPIGVATRWFPVADDGSEGQPEVGPLAPLPLRVEPGASIPVDVVLYAPERPGRYRLCLALQQVGVAWFGFRTDALVEVADRSPAPESPTSESPTSESSGDDLSEAGADPVPPP